MPLYEYRCQKCGQVSEKIQKFADRPLTKCEKCGGKLERLVSAPAFQFKGSGWYVTDYARKSPAPDSSTTAPASGSDGNKAAESSGNGKKTAEPSKAKEAPKPSSKK